MRKGIFKTYEKKPNNKKYFNFDFNLFINLNVPSMIQYSNHGTFSCLSWLKKSKNT